MRPQEGRRYPDEAFYFDSPNPGYKGELVVDKAVLTVPYPEVYLLKGKDVLAVVTDSDGEEQGIGHGGVDWEFDFTPGDRVVRLETSSRPSEHGWTESGKRTYTFPEPVTDVYEIQPRDSLLLKLSFCSAQSDFGWGEHIMHPANQPLPGAKGQESWRLEGVAAADDRLIAWQVGYRWLVDLAIANKLMTNWVDYVQIRDEFTPDHSLRGHLETEPALKLYLAYFAMRKGVDYFPSKDPFDRVLAGELQEPKSLTKEQFTRYYPERTT